VLVAPVELVPGPITAPTSVPPQKMALSNLIPSSELWSSPLPDELLPFPYLSRHLTSLPPQERDNYIARVMCLSEHDRMQEDKGLEADHLLNDDKGCLASAVRALRLRSRLTKGIEK
jgi:hypothetical protein